MSVADRVGAPGGARVRRRSTHPDGRRRTFQLQQDSGKCQQHDIVPQHTHHQQSEHPGGLYCQGGEFLSGLSYCFAETLLEFLGGFTVLLLLATKQVSVSPCQLMCSYLCSLLGVDTLFHLGLNGV